MATPVVTVASGGLPVVDVTATFPKMGAPVTEAAAGRGTAVTKVAAGGMPVTYSTVADYPAGGGPFTPASLTGLIGWWDTSITASLTLSGSNVTAFADQSGGSNTLANGGLGRTLPYSATAFNTSFPGIKPVSGNGFLETSSAFPMGTGNTLTAWYVGTTATGGSTAGGRTLSYAAPGAFDFDNANSWTISNASSLTTNTSVSRNGLNVTVGSLAASPAGHRFIYTINSSGVMTAYVDGVASSTTTSPGNWIAAGHFDLFRQAAHDSDFWYGTLAEAGVATGFSSPAVVAQLDTYLKNKWGL
jgi:hypothetical protein